MAKKFEIHEDDDGTRYTYLVADSGELVPVETTLSAERWVVIAEDLDRAQTAAQYMRTLRYELQSLLNAWDMSPQPGDALRAHFESRLPVLRALCGGDV